ncbi:hypothetical protein D3C85_1752220 [compost metagenome]
MHPQQRLVAEHAAAAVEDRLETALQPATGKLGDIALRGVALQVLFECLLTIESCHHASAAGLAINSA